MKVKLIAVGKVKAPFAEADAHYRKMLQRYQPVQTIEVRDEANVERRIPVRSHVIALDRGGRAMSSQGWSQWLAERRVRRRSHRRMRVVERLLYRPPALRGKVRDDPLDLLDGRVVQDRTGMATGGAARCAFVGEPGRRSRVA